VTKDQIVALGHNCVILDEISENTFKYIEEAIHEKGKEGNPTLNFSLSNEGGSIQYGLKICDILNEYPGHTVGFVRGIARSMSVYVLQCMGERLATPTAYIHIHNVRIKMFPYETLHSRRRKKELRELVRPDQLRLMEILVRRTGRSLRDVYRTCLIDNPMPADKAFEYGLLDKVTGNIHGDFLSPEDRVVRERS
jgi:ATP-dependent Clp protease, protease subunit